MIYTVQIYDYYFILGRYFAEYQLIETFYLYPDYYKNKHVQILTN